jgi:hypothetical protein
MDELTGKMLGEDRQNGWVAIEREWVLELGANGLVDLYKG